MLRFWTLPAVSISADRTTRTLVENAGRPLVASRIAFELRCYFPRGGVQRVGRADVTWVVGDGVVLGIGHAPPGIFRAAAADPLVYLVKLIRTTTPSGGSRAWWVCPACGRRCGALYLPHDRERLGCRTCCGLVYASQYPPLKCKRKRRRKPT